MGDMSSLELNVTDWLAIYGAILSTLLAVARGVAWRRTRATRIEVVLSAGYHQRPEKPPSPGGFPRGQKQE
jgi:hypothetical protein